MIRKPILVIAPQEEHERYRHLPLWEERLVIHSFNTFQTLFNDTDPDILILDCGFDDRKGLQMLSEIKANRPDIPIIFLTDAGSEQTAVNAFRLGARNYFKKPFDMFELKRNIEDILEMKRSSSECRAPMRIDSVNGDDQTVCDLPEIPPQLLRSVRYIKENFNGHITIDVLASEAGLSKYHFCRKFRTALGSSPMNFVTLMRIERAKELLRRGKSISIIAMEVGFNDFGNFSKSFKKLTGLTPSAYKDSLHK